MTKSKVTTVVTGKALRYVGDGTYIYGVPARDLSVEEAAQYAAMIDANAKATGKALYVPSDSEIQEGVE